MSEWQEVGAPKASIAPVESMLNIPAPADNERYKEVTKRLEAMHGELLRLEEQSKLANTSDVPGLAAEYQRRLRIHVNLLFGFLNTYIDVLSDLQKEFAELWNSLYTARLAAPKGTPSAAKTHADALTKRESMTIEIVKNRIQQIKNDYERYNGICIALQSTVKAENTERMAG